MPCATGFGVDRVPAMTDAETRTRALQRFDVERRVRRDHGRGRRGRLRHRRTVRAAGPAGAPERRARRAHRREGARGPTTSAEMMGWFWGQQTKRFTPLAAFAPSFAELLDNEFMHRWARRDLKGGLLAEHRPGDDRRAGAGRAGACIATSPSGRSSEASGLRRPAGDGQHADRARTTSPRTSARRASSPAATGGPTSTARPTRPRPSRPSCRPAARCSISARPCTRPARTRRPIGGGAACT